MLESTTGEGSSNEHRLQGIHNRLAEVTQKPNCRIKRESQRGKLLLVFLQTASFKAECLHDFFYLVKMNWDHAQNKPPAPQIKSVCNHLPSCTLQSSLSLSGDGSSHSKQSRLHGTLPQVAAPRYPPLLLPQTMKSPRPRILKLLSRERNLPCAIQFNTLHSRHRQNILSRSKERESAQAR